MTAKTYDLTFDGYWRSHKISGLPPQSGLYCVYACTYNQHNSTVSIRKLLYIGESENIQSRVANHERWKDWEKELQYGEILCFNAALVRVDGDRLRTEAAMIFHHKPPCNKEFTDSFPFDTTSISTSGKNAELDAYFTVQTKKSSGGGFTSDSSLLGRW